MTESKQPMSTRAKWACIIAVIVLLAICFIAIMGSGFLLNESGDDGSSTKGGLYTLAQVDRGRVIYAQQCTMCHPANMEKNGATPALVGEVFLDKWRGRPVEELFQLTLTTMPVNSPGFLTADQTADLLALIFHANGFPAGDVELSADEDVLNGITILEN